MRKYLLLAGVAACLISSCGKNETPVPDDPSKETPGTNPGNGNPATQKLLYADPAFKAPTSFTSAHAFPQTDGKVIVDAYTTVNDQNVIKIYRLNTNGSLDASFDIDGDRTWFIKSVAGIFVLADGKILLGGEFTVNGKSVGLVRLNNTGLLDKSYVSPFSLNGNNMVMGLQRVANGKVIVTGKYSLNSWDKTYIPSMLRLNSDGTIDASFSVSGEMVPRYNYAYHSVVPLTNGKILVAGRFLLGVDSDKRDYIVLLNDNGSIDYSFKFKLIPDASASILNVAVQSDGKIFIQGAFDQLTDPSIRDAVYRYGGVARLNSDGSLDQSFNSLSDLNGAILGMSTLSDNRLVTIISTPSGQWNTIKDYIKLYGVNGEKDNSYSFQYGKSIINSLFRLSPDNFLLTGQIDVDGVKYPVIKLKKN